MASAIQFLLNSIRGYYTCKSSDCGGGDYAIFAMKGNNKKLKCPTEGCENYMDYVSLKDDSEKYLKHLWETEP